MASKEAKPIVGKLLAVLGGVSIDIYINIGSGGVSVGGGVTTSFLYDGASVLLEKQGASTTATYTYGNALVRKDGETPLYDGQGSERTVTNAAQAVTGTLTQDGFGNTVASTGASSSPYMYAATSGYRNDGDAGLSKVGCRYYDAQVGRFISRDTFLDQKPYLYCEHDPVNHLDPSGHMPQVLVDILAGLGLAAGGSATTVGSLSTLASLPAAASEIAVASCVGGFVIGGVVTVVGVAVAAHYVGQCLADYFYPLDN